MRLWPLLLLLSGCTLRIDFVSRPTPEVERWQQQITQRVNEHDTRLNLLDGGVHERSDPSTSTDKR